MRIHIRNQQKKFLLYAISRNQSRYTQYKLYQRNQMHNRSQFEKYLVQPAKLCSR